MKTVLRCVASVLFASLLSVAVSSEADAAHRAGARSSYDGSWSVLIQTLRGDCGSVRAALRIAGGRVYAQDSSYQAYGAVAPGGAVRVNVAGAGRSAAGSGRLSLNSGNGRWRSSGGECYGTWSAVRHVAYY
jgi:hypothetical protein